MTKYLARLFYYPGLISSGYYEVSLDAIPEKWEMAYFKFEIPANVCQISFHEIVDGVESLESPIIHIRPAGGRVVTAEEALEILGATWLSKDEAISLGGELRPVVWDICVNERKNLVFHNGNFLIFNDGDILVTR